MGEIEEIYQKLADRPALLRMWQTEAKRCIDAYVKRSAEASPFLDRPQKAMYGSRKGRDGESLTIYGTSPNAARVRGADVPVGRWREERRAFHIYGRSGKWARRWTTIHRTQITRDTTGVELQDVPYYGTAEKPEAFFGVKKGGRTLAYGRTPSGIALPVYAADSYADWIMREHLDEVENLILEAGRYAAARLGEGEV